MKLSKVLISCGVAALVGIGAIYASSTKHFDHENMHSKDEVNPTQSIILTGGEAAFGEISRVVEILNSNPKTNWDEVDLSSLREHLVDMSNVTLQAKVSSSRLVNGAEFLVTSNDPEVIQSIQAMAIAHGAMMNSESKFDWQSTQTKQGVRVVVTSNVGSAVSKINALGFHGLLALGNHHSQHHEMLASGSSPH